MIQTGILKLFCWHVMAAAWLFAASASQAASLANISSRDASAGLKEALTRGAQVAIQQLGTENGFFGNDKLRIPLPESLQKAESLMRRFGMGKQADELVLRMNRAAEAAVPEARTLLINSIRQMSIQDAKSILTGGDDAATQYFRRTTAEPLTQKFLPIVKRAMDNVALAERYSDFAKAGARFGLVREEDANLDQYITRKALDALYFVIAEEEKKIRVNPLGAASSVIRRVFGALGR